MLRLAGLAAALAACSSASGSTPTSATPPSPAPATAQAKPQQIAKPAMHLPDAPDDKDSQLITKQLVAMNSDAKWGRPSTRFNAGTVTPRDTPTAKKTAHGYEIKFSNNSPVSTPTEFYAFDARTGKGAYGLDLSDDGPSAGACDDGVCAFNTESCTTFAIDAKT